MARLIPDELFDVLHAPAIIQLESLQLRLLDAVLALPNSRQQEFEADFLGVMLSSAARYDPKQVPPLWLELAEREAHHRESTPEIFATHPDWQRRSERLREWQEAAVALSKGELEILLPQTTSTFPPPPANTYPRTPRPPASTPQPPHSQHS
uniref:Peptidase M48 domain-containing protein n=1 Tax=Lotharella globosa TaxID=91324 RepID=A0A7S3Z113_9EUKA